METRIFECFERLKSEINEWENSLKHWAVSAVEINLQFISFSKVIHNLENQALLARVAIPICEAISSLKEVIAFIKRRGLKGPDPQIDIATLCSSQTLDSVFLQWVEFIYYKPHF